MMTMMIMMFFKCSEIQYFIDFYTFIYIYIYFILLLLNNNNNKNEDDEDLRNI